MQVHKHQGSGHSKFLNLFPIPIALCCNKDMFKSNQTSRTTENTIQSINQNLRKLKNNLVVSLSGKTCVACPLQRRRHIGITILRLPSSSCVVVVVGVTKNFCHIFLGNHTGQLPYIWHRASVWRTVSCNAFLNLRHVHFLFCVTLNIVDIGKFAHKIISVTFFSGTTEASFLIFGTEHQYGELYRLTQFLICGMSTSCMTRLSIFKRKEVGRRHMSSLEDLLLSYFFLTSRPYNDLTSPHNYLKSGCRNMPS